jgi:uncharacterized iron-regulated protein
MRFRSFQVAAISVFILALGFMTASAGLNLNVFDAQGRQLDLESVITDLSRARAVFIGESHDRYDHHVSELEIIRRLYERDMDRLAIGVEFIQRPFQRDLDAYIAGEIDEREFLRRTQYFDRWGYDFRLYRPIFRFAREHGIPMIALNASQELTRKVARVGLDGLTESEKAGLPGQMDTSDDRYRNRLRKVFDEHSGSTGGNFDRFWEAQLVWDETMAEEAAQYLSTHPDKALVILAGRGHVESGFGIPNRVRRRLPDCKMATLVTADKVQTRDHVADYFLISNKEVLPPAPKMGISLDVSVGVRVKDVPRPGPAADSGLKPEDQIVSIDGQDVKTLGDVRLALLNKQSGDHLLIRARRNNSAGVEDFTFGIVLQ